MRNRLQTWTGVLALASVYSLGTGSRSDADTKLLRFPDLHGDKVVFTYAGDLWTAPAGGGLASRLTAHPGLELFAKFSPDGQQIAFTGQYDGDEQVYVIPSSGGEPRQLTYYPARGPLPDRWGFDNQVYGWSPDGKSVVFRSMREGWTMTDTRLYTVPAAGGLPKALPMPVSGGGAFSPDGTKIVYSPLTREFRTWKRYQGGWAQDLYIFDLATSAIEPVAHSPRSERDPMWIGDKIYFASDRTGTLNLFEFDTRTKGVRQLTDEHRARRPLAQRRRRRPDRLRTGGRASCPRPPVVPVDTDPDHRAHRRPGPAAVEGRGRPVLDRGLCLEPQGRAGLVRRPRATSSRRRSRKGPCGTSPVPRAPTTRPPAGRPTASRSLTFRTPPARRSST